MKEQDFIAQVPAPPKECLPALFPLTPEEVMSIFWVDHSLQGRIPVDNSKTELSWFGNGTEVGWSVMLRSAQGEPLNALRKFSGLRLPIQRSLRPAARLRGTKGAIDRVAFKLTLCWTKPPAAAAGGESDLCADVDV